MALRGLRDPLGPLGPHLLGTPAGDEQVVMGPMV